jgi:RNA polymerase sigma-70 factor, ECF subfamily
VTCSGLPGYEDNQPVAGRVIVIDAVAHASEDTLAVAVRKHSRLVYRVAYSVLRNHHDAEDATQETFMRVLRYGKNLAGVRDQKTWLARIAWNIAVDRKRKTPHPSHADSFVDQVPSAADSAHEQAIQSQRSAQLEKLIAGLPGSLRDVVTLSTVQEMSLTEVASVLQIPESAVRSRMFRAREILKQKFAALMEGKHGT